MDCNNIFEVIYCHEDDEYRVYCPTCENLCKERFYRKHLKPQTHTNKLHKKLSYIN